MKTISSYIFWFVQDYQTVTSGRQRESYSRRHSPVAGFKNRRFRSRNVGEATVERIVGAHTTSLLIRPQYHLPLRCRVVVVLLQCVAARISLNAWPVVRIYFFFLFLLSSVGRAEPMLNLTTLPYIFIHVACQVSSIVFATQR